MRRWEGARRGGFVSIKGIEVLSYSTSTLRYHSFSLPAATPYLYFAPAPSIPFLFPASSHARPCALCLVETVTRLEDESFASNKLPHIQLASTRVLCFLLSRRNLVKHTELPLMVTLFSHLMVFPSLCGSWASGMLYDMSQKWFHYECQVLKLQNCLVLNESTFCYKL